MLFTIFALLATFLLSAAVQHHHVAAAPSFAAPPATRFPSQRANEPCVPPFNGVGVSVTNSARELGVQQPPAANDSVTSQTSNTKGTLATVDFYFHPVDGEDSPQLFTISPTGGYSLAVAVLEGGNLTLADATEGDKSQHWSVQCDTCNADSSMEGQFSYGCNLTSAVDGQCVQLAHDANSPVYLAPCAGIDAQNFDLWTQCDWC